MRNLFIVALVSFSLLIAGCPEDKPKVAFIGTLNSKLKSRLEEAFSLTPHTSSEASAMLVHSSYLPRLTPGQKASIIQSYKAGWPIVILDADSVAINKMHDIFDPELKLVRAFPKKNQATFLATIFRKKNGRHHPQHIADPSGVTNYESALDSAVNQIMKNIELDTPSSASQNGNEKFALSAGGFNISQNPVATQTLTIPQPYGGSFNSNVAAYAFHNCCGDQDIYVTTAQLDATPGSDYQSAWGSGITTSSDGSKSVNTWKPGVFIPSCGATNTADAPLNSFPGLQTDFSVSHSDSACRLVDYPLWYYVAMEPAAALQPGDQCNALPTATAGVSTDYSSGFSFSVDGSIGYYGEGAEVSPGVDISATWDEETSVTIPATIVSAGKTLAGQGQFWQITYCGTNSTTSCNDTGIGTTRGKLDCTDALTLPQNGQTRSGTISNTTQEAYWKAGPETRVGSTFDITVTLAANLANTEIRVWDEKVSVEDPKCPVCTTPGGGTCTDTEVEACGCQPDTSTQLPSGANQQDPSTLYSTTMAIQSLTFQIPFPPTSANSTCPLPCTESVKPSGSDPGCTCVCPTGSCPAVDSGCPS